MQPYGKCQNVSSKRSNDEIFEVKRLGEVEP